MNMGVALLNDAYLILENGTVFRGQPFGYKAGTVGELVFNTSMTGYLETLADPVYYGQIVVQTFPLIGNYGVIPPDFGPGPVHLKAYIVRDWCQEPSNFRSEGNLDSFLRENKIPGLYGIDTRKLTRILRENGTMNATITSSPELSDEQWTQLRGYKIKGAVKAVCTASSEYKDQNTETISDAQRAAIDINTITKKSITATEKIGQKPKPRIIVWNFGNGPKIAAQLRTLGITPAMANFDATAAEIQAQTPTRIILSGGPGDPEENTGIIKEIAKLYDTNTPILGIGLGHQMLALANGAKTIKLPFGHRGANQPVEEQKTGRVFITTQNHGYTVTQNTLPKNAEISHKNTNDETCEGIKYKNTQTQSIQFNLTEELLKKYLMRSADRKEPEVRSQKSE